MQKNSRSITNLAGNFLSAVYLPENAKHISKILVLYMQPSQHSSVK